MKNYFRMLQFLKGHRRRFSWAILLILISSLFEGVQLSFMLPVIDRIFTNKKIIIPNQVPSFLKNIVDYLNNVDVHVLFWLIPTAFMTMFAIKQVVLFWSDFMMNDIAQGVMRDVRSKLFERIQTLSLDYFSKKRTGELVSRITIRLRMSETKLLYPKLTPRSHAIINPCPLTLNALSVTFFISHGDKN